MSQHPGGGSYNPAHFQHFSQHGLLAAQAVRNALANPYSQQQPGLTQVTVASHYAQAYQQHAQAHVNYMRHSTSTGIEWAQPFNQGQTAGPSSHNPRRPFQNHGPWYEPGSHSCTHEGCRFTGSKKSVEIHMMDRHLVYPPGWEKRKRKSDWDADPSLIG